MTTLTDSDDLIRSTRHALKAARTQRVAAEVLAEAFHWIDLTEILDATAGAYNYARQAHDSAIAARAEVSL